jgi:hypothetical protein
MVRIGRPSSVMQAVLASAAVLLLFLISAWQEADFEPAGLVLPPETSELKAIPPPASTSPRTLTGPASPVAICAVAYIPPQLP